MKIKFLGGGKEVGRVGMLLEMDDSTLLFDYGITPENPPKYPQKAPPVDKVFLSHAHLDHSGMIPWLSREYHLAAFSTPLTASISQVLFKDCLKIAETEGYPFPYNKSDIRNAEFLDISHDQVMNLGDAKIRFHSAGHIPGSTMFELEGSRHILFTGDLNTIDTRLLHGAKPVKCDILFLEGTYAGKEHPERKELEKEFIQKIEGVIEKGIAIIPVFAVGRTQEIAMILKDSGFDVWLDGMGKKISEIFLNYPDEIESVEELKRAIGATKFVRSSHDRKLALKGEVILTTSGMLDGGPVLSYIEKLKNDPQSAIMLTGYQVEGTNGRNLLENGRINVRGVSQKVECEVCYFDFSAHAGHSKLVDFARRCDPEKVAIFHSDDASPLADEIEDFAEVLIGDNFSV